MLRVALIASLSCLAAAQPTDQEGVQCIATTTFLSTADYEAILSSLATAVADSRNPRLVDRANRGDLVGGIVRLAFHDAAGFDQNSPDGLGPDGCFDATNPDNSGLPELVEELDLLWAPFCSKISKADFWVLAAKVAVEATATQPIEVAFRYGRTTAATCSYEGPTRLPGAQTGLDEIRRVFQDQMGLTMRSAVALLGAHTLGRAEARFSGFEGRWTRNVDELSNEYFESIVHDGWSRTDTDDDHTLWVRGQEIMLNADMELAYDAAAHTGEGARCGGISNLGNRNQCDSNADEADSPYPHTLEFANDQAAWYIAFADAMEQMSELGHDNLRAVGAEQVSTTTAPADASTADASTTAAAATTAAATAATTAASTSSTTAAVTATTTTATKTTATTTTTSITTSSTTGTTSSVTSTSTITTTNIVPASTTVTSTTSTSSTPTASTTSSTASTTVTATTVVTATAREPSAGCKAGSYPVLMGNGICPEDTHQLVESLAACEALAAELGNSDITAASQNSKRRPRGCYVAKRKLFFNGDKGSATATNAKRQSICCTKDAAAVAALVGPSEGLLFSSAAFASQAATGGSSSSSSKSNAAASISAALVLVLVVGTVGVALKRSRNKQNSSGDASALKEPFESPTVVGAAADGGAAQDAPECFEEREFVQSDSGGIGIKSVRRPNPAYRVSTIDTEGGKLDSATTL